VPGGNYALSKNISLYSFLLITIFFIPSLVWASVAGEVNKANDLYKQGKFDDSLNLYQEALDKDGKSPVIKYDLGTALYKKGDYAKAYGFLEQAAHEKNIKIKPKAEYNLGNVLYRSGMQKANTNVDAAIKTLQEALGHYGQTIAIDPKDQDAIFNQDFVKKAIERLKKQKQQQQQKNQQQKQNQKQQQQNQQNQQNQQKQQENQQSQQNKSKDQKNKQSSSESQAQKQQNAQAQAQQDQKELDRKQAEDLLEEYQENEEPKKLLNYMPKKIDDRPVLKDW
jgi:Ca-activated chloride channel family protein